MTRPRFLAAWFGAGLALDALVLATGAVFGPWAAARAGVILGGAMLTCRALVLVYLAVRRVARHFHPLNP